MAVYTEVSDEDLQRFVAQYELGQVVSYKGIAEGVENSNYLLVTERGSFILTLYEKRVDPADLPFFLGLMEHLAAKGVDCPVPVHGKDGLALRELCGRPAVIVTFLAGMSPKRAQSEHCSELGGGLARVHLAGADFAGRRRNALSVEGWRALLAATAPRADEVSPGLRTLLREQFDRLAAEWPASLPTGIIHADLFPDNVFFRDGKLTGLIDFYFACTDILAYDIAVCLNAWCFEQDGAYNATKAKLLVGAYRRERALSEAELQALPLLARGAALRFLLTRLYDWLNRAEGALVRPKDPLEYLKKLRFHAQAKSLGDYGLDL